MNIFEKIGAPTPLWAKTIAAICGTGAVAITSIWALDIELPEKLNSITTTAGVICYIGLFFFGSKVDAEKLNKKLKQRKTKKLNTMPTSSNKELDRNSTGYYLSDNTPVEVVVFSPDYSQSDTLSTCPACLDASYEVQKVITASPLSVGYIITDDVPEILGEDWSGFQAHANYGIKPTKHPGVPA